MLSGLLSVSLSQLSLSHTSEWIACIMLVRDVAHSVLVGNMVYRMVQRGSGVFISAADVAEATRVLLSVAERCFLSQDLTRHLPEVPGTLQQHRSC